MGNAWVHPTGDEERPTQDIEIEHLGGDRYAVTIDGVTEEIDAFATEGGVSLRRDGRVIDATAERRGDTLRIVNRSGRYDVDIVDRRTWEMRTALGAHAGQMKPELVSPMAGKVVLVRVAAGDEVKEGQTLVIVEAMKMENEIRATADTVIREVRVAAGDLVNPGDVLLAFEVEPE